MDLQLFAERMVELIPQLMRGMSRHEHNSFTRGEITLPMLSAMECLARSGACPMHEVAQFLDISRPSATALINRLLAQQLARREHDAKDRRIVRVTLSPKGRKVLTDIWSQKKRTLIDVFGQIAPAQRTQYLQTLEQVVGILAAQSKPSIATRKK